MYGLPEYGISRQHREEIRQEVAVVPPGEAGARESRGRAGSSAGSEMGACAVRGALRQAPRLQPQPGAQGGRHRMGLGR
jgi:hypothetical protein